MLTDEDLRPQTLDEMVGQEQALRVLRGFAAQAKQGIQPPHLMLSGPFGVGKTTAAYAFARSVLGEQWRDNFLELDTTADRGVDLLRATVRDYFQRLPSNGVPFKFLLLDEADYLTEPAQAMLRRPLETDKDMTVCIFACNTPSKIIGAIHSRVAHLRFHPFSDQEITTILQRAAAKMNQPPPSPELIQTVLRHAKGLGRDAINALKGGEEGRQAVERMMAFDAALERVFAAVPKNGSTIIIPKQDRVDGFLEFLRAEGYDQWEEILVAIDTAVRDKRIALAPNLSYGQHIADSIMTARSFSFVQLPLFQLRGYLDKVVG